MQRAARLANGLQPLAARVRHAAHHTLLQRAALCCSGRHCVANAATGCNNLQQVATICNRLQQTALCCNRLRCWSVAADRTVLQSSLQPVATGCGLLQRAVVSCNGLWSIATNRTVLQSSLQPVATGCSPLQIAVVCCNGRHCAATGRHALQPVVLRCCSTRDRCREHVVCAALSSRQQVAPGLRSVAAGCGQLQHGTALQQIALHHCCRALFATGSVAPQQVALRCNRHYNRLHRCTALQQVERRTVLQQNRTLLQHAVHCCNRLRSRAAVLRCRTERRCNPRCAAATYGQQCWLRRRTNLLSAVATRDALLQRSGNCCGCVVARTC